MSVLTDLLGETDLSTHEVRHIRHLLAEWQIVADLSFADLLLFVPAKEGQDAGYRCIGQMRPYTAQTIYVDDLVGDFFLRHQRPMVGRGFAEGRVIRDADPDWSTGVPVREEAIPVGYGNRIIAVISREANVATARSPSQLELTYLQAASQLAVMMAAGTFPYAVGDRPEDSDASPRVGDGIIRINAGGTVTYASPNAISAYRRLGHVDAVHGQNIADIDPRPGDAHAALDGNIAVMEEIEHDGSVVLRRFMPLLEGDQLTGALVLVRDITERRRHQKALRVKDATIREIHHRVKNNLQTVASLLRLQGRRMASDEGREALAESVRRISSIALVHEILSREARQEAMFSEIATRIVDMLREGLVSPDTPVEFTVTGDPGELPAEVATPLALVLTELVQNSVEHAFVEFDFSARRGAVDIAFDRHSSTLSIIVSDNGRGLPEGVTLESLSNLGLQIVRTLVGSELGGTLHSLEPEQGTAVEIVIPLQVSG
ncbi:sensor histidine kinase [Euzebya tangerina]|uniref:sensor histidine kinase n=1 Tax=Euzebya tangerina TaxID=591198 RepID=UPI000E310337|nr:PAS domain-containing sensor histidine kinase [Euzebya tangerina]